MKVIDMHCDTISEILSRNISSENSASNNREGEEDLGENTLHISLDKMEKAGYLLQNFAMFVNMKKHEDPFGYCLELIDCFYRQMERYKTRIGLVLSYEDIEKNEREGKMSALLTVEEGGVTGLKLAHLRNLYRLGVRMITLTWNHENGIGYPNIHNGNFPNMSDGLTRYGIEFVEEMERLGMIIDVSHLSDKGFYDVLRYTRKPFVASHSNARALCAHGRNLTDDCIRLLAERGGVIGVNYYTDFLKKDMTCEEEERSLWYIADHIEHIVGVGGYECVGLGSDFDGIPTNKGIPDCSYLPKLYDVLVSRGMKESVIEACFYKNVLRLYREIL